MQPKDTHNPEWRSFTITIESDEEGSESFYHRGTASSAHRTAARRAKEFAAFFIYDDTQIKSVSIVMNIDLSDVDLPDYETPAEREADRQGLTGFTRTVFLNENRHHVVGEPFIQ